MIQNLLILGGTGFIGHHLAQKAVNIGFKTSVISLNFPIEQRKVNNVNYISADITNLSDLKEKLPEQIDYVINLSGYINHSSYLEEGYKVINSHLGGLQNIITLLDWKKLKRFIQVGSSDEYGHNVAPQNEEMFAHPISAYSYSKFAANELLKMLYKTESFPVVMLRLFLVYGPGQDNKRFLPQIIEACLSDSTFPVSSGKQLRDFCYIDDVVNGIILSLRTKGIEGEIINLASGKAQSILGVINFVKSLVGKGNPQFGKIPYRKNENMELYADINKATELLGWKQEVSFEQGIIKTIDYYQSKI